jgi:hypothetical protein
MGAQFPVWCARLRMPLLWVAVAFLVGGAFLSWTAWMGLAGLVLLVAGLSLYFRVGTVRRPPVEVAAPVAGRWQALNSPADKVPSHGLHAYGQTYAIDLVHEPAGGSRPEFGSGPSRELTGPSRILGNHVVLDLGDGVYAAFAHLRRGSLRVAKGQRVGAGEQVAECGNSGNSTEPHLHFQLMDHRSVLFAAGLQFRLDRFEVDGTVQAGVPANGQPFTTSPPRAAAEGR